MALEVPGAGNPCSQLTMRNPESGVVGRYITSRFPDCRNQEGGQSCASSCETPGCNSRIFCGMTKILQHGSGTESANSALQTYLIKGKRKVQVLKALQGL